MTTTPASATNLAVRIPPGLCVLGSPDARSVNQPAGIAAELFVKSRH